MRGSNNTSGKKGKIIKIGIIILAFIAIIVSSIIQSNAAVEDWRVRLKELSGYDGVQYYKKDVYYVNIYGENGEVEEIRYLEKGTRQWIYIMIDPVTEEEQVAYCLASGLDFGNKGGFQADTQSQGSFSDYFDNLSEAARTGIAYASILGYSDKEMALTDPGPVKGTTGADFWMATQAIIWEYQQGIRVDAGKRVGGEFVKEDDYYCMVQGKPAEKCYDYLLDLIKKASSVPTYASSAPDSPKSVVLTETALNSGQYYKSLFSMIPPDTGEYFFTDLAGNELSYLSFELNGRQHANLRSSRSIPEEQTVVLRRRGDENTKGASVFYSPQDPEFQTMLSSRGVLESPFCLYLKVKTEDKKPDLARVELVKTSETGYVKGFEFELKGLDIMNAHVSLKATTDSTGTAVWENLIPGRYTLKELLPEDSIWNQPETLTVTVRKDELTEVTLHNRLKKVALTVKKQIYTDEFIPAHGEAVFIFEIKNEEAGLTFRRAVQFKAEDLETARGEVMIKEFSLTGLPPGTYVIEELKTLRYELFRTEVSEGGEVASGKAYITVRSPSDSAWACFTNRVINQGGTSHTAFCENLFNYKGS